MNQITDAVLLTSSMKILNRKARYIKEKLNLTEINIDWKVLEEKIYFSQKSYQSPIVLGENEQGYVKLKPNEAVITSSIITAPSPIDITASSIMKYVKSKGEPTDSLEDALTYAILQALAFVEANGEEQKYENILKKYIEKIRRV